MQDYKIHHQIASDFVSKYVAKHDSKLICDDELLRLSYLQQSQIARKLLNFVVQVVSRIYALEKKKVVIGRRISVNLEHQVFSSR